MTARRLLPATIAVLVGLALVVAALLVPRLVDNDASWSGIAGAPADPPSLGGGGNLSDTIVGDHSTGMAHTSDEVDYAQTPPMGGEHDPAWLECGHYDEPVRDENVVHSLEHGTVWITHDPDLPPKDVAALARLLPDEGILSPYPGLPAPVVVTVWNRQLRLTGADDPRLALFVEEFGDGATSPEPFASCRGGLTPDQTRPGYDPDAVEA